VRGRRWEAKEEDFWLNDGGVEEDGSSMGRVWRAGRPSDSSRPP